MTRGEVERRETRKKAFKRRHDPEHTKETDVDRRALNIAVRYRELKQKGPSISKC